MSWRPLLLAVVLAFAVPVGSADHVQGDARQVSFDHKGGNEWWVEVALGGPDAASVQKVEAKDTGGAWRELEKKEWGVYAASFHIEPGHDVRFRATWGEERMRSCWFTHPGGIEQCGGEAGLVFDHNGGNEWWVQVAVTGDPSRVQAKDTDGTWTELEKKDWGDWAASFHIEPGHDVRFRAMLDEWQRSCWFTHPGGVTPEGGSTCGPDGGDTGGDPGGDPGGDFDASFSTNGGNEWWVEVYVDANEPLEAVHARDDGGPWIALEKKSWGAWARSFHVEDGSIIEFRATSQDGDREISGPFQWPSGEPVASGPATVDVAFGPKAGNGWWVETIVVGNAEHVGSVQARAGNGAWHDLTYREWGAWAASFHVPAGSDVQFRASTPTGTDRSVWFTWPDAKPVGSDGSWPEEGSYVVKDEHHTSSAGPVTNHWRADEVYHDGAWWYHDSGTREDPGGTSPIERWGRFEEQRYQRTDVSPGDTYDGVTVRGADGFDLHVEGDPVTIDAWWGTWREPGCEGPPESEPCDSAEIWWDQATGLEVDRSNSIATRTGTGFEVLDTDAPLAVR